MKSLNTNVIFSSQLNSMNFSSYVSYRSQGPLRLYMPYLGRDVGR